MPDIEMVKTIIIGDTSRAIAATYDAEGNEIIGNYGTINVADPNVPSANVYTKQQSNNRFLTRSTADDLYLTQENISDAVVDAVQPLINEGKIKVLGTERVTLKKDIRNLQLLTTNSNKDENYGRHVLIKIYKSNVKQETGTVNFDGKVGNTLDAAYWEPGATFEVYESFLFCTSSKGISTVYYSKEEGLWESLELIAAEGVTFSAIIFDESWDNTTQPEGEE